MGRANSRCAIAASGLALACSLASGADEWRLSRGDSALTGRLESGLPASLDTQWLFEAQDAIESTPAVADGTVYLTSTDGHLYAIELATGKLRWKHDGGAPIKSSPAVGEFDVYFGDEDGVFHALSIADGSERWRFEAEAEIVSSANLVQGKILFGSHDQNIYCLDGNGKLLWKVPTDGFVYGTPAVHEGRVISAGCDGFLRVLSLTDGRELARVELGGYVGASPAISRGRAYLGTFENRFIAVDLAQAKVLWSYENSERRFPYLSSAATDGKRVVVGGRDKTIHGLDADSGERVWSCAAGAGVDSSPVIVGDRVFVGTGNGKVLSLALATGKELWSFDTGSGIVGSPAVAEGRLLIGTTDGQLFVFGATKDGK
jgi:eukaryotic-like serine/threonine-protein kinase